MVRAIFASTEPPLSAGEVILGCVHWRRWLTEWVIGREPTPRRWATGRRRKHDGRLRKRRR